MRGGWLLVLLCAAACSGAAVPNDQAQSETSGDPMQIRVELPRRKWAAGEMLLATVSIENTGAIAITIPDPQSNANWQPTYTLRRPDGESQATSLRTAVFGAPGGPLDPSLADLVTVEPGATHAIQLQLDHLFEFLQPGHYALEAHLDWDGLTAQSPMLEIDVESTRLRSARICAAAGAQDPYSLSVFVLDDGGGVSIASFLEDAQTDTVRRTSLTAFAQVPADAMSIFLPWNNVAGLGTPSPRVGWQSGATLGLVDFRETGSLSGGLTMELPFPPTVVHPALSTAEGAVDVFVLDAAGERLGLVRFPPADAGPPLGRIGEPPPVATAPPQPRLLWTEPTRGRVIAFAASITSPASGSRRLACYLTVVEDQVQFFVVDAGDGSGAPTLRVMPLGAREDETTGSAPTVRLESDGAVVGSMLVFRKMDDGTRAVLLKEVRFDASGEATSKYDGSVDVATTPTAGVVAHAVTPASAGRLDWLFVLPNGTVRSSGAPAVSQTLTGTPVHPLQLLGLDDFRYLLTTSPEGASGFERVR